MLLKGSRFTTAYVRRLALATTGLLAVVFLFSAPVVSAQTQQGGATQPFQTQNIDTIATQAGVDNGADIYQIIGNIINVVFSVLGVLLLCYFLYAGYLWMTAGGETEPLQKAKTILKNAIIGLLIIVSAFAITRFVLSWLAGANDGGVGGGGSGALSRGIGAGSGFPGSAGALGAGLIDYHIPERDAREVPRNTSVMIAFKQPIDPASAIVGYSESTSSTAHDLNTDAIHIFRTGQELSTTLRSADVEAYVTQDHQTLVLRPKTLLGSSSANTDYSVRLVGGDRGLRLDASDGGRGASIFGGGDGYLQSVEGYLWRFEVSTVVDNTPPKVVSVVPVATGEYAPNVVIQMNFDKPLLPLSAQGTVRSGSGFQNIEVAASPIRGTGSSRPDGIFTLSNQFRTIEFVTNVSCGVNSCGRQVFCLPFSSNIGVRIKAATLSEVPPQARIIRNSGGDIYDGIVDYLGNSLDGNADGVAQGPGDGAGFDDYQWQFQTGATPNLTAPRVKTVTPAVRSSNVPVDARVSADFDSIIQDSTLSSDSVKLRTNEPDELRDTMWWMIRSELIRADGGVVGDGDRPAGSRVQVQHRPFTPAQTTDEGMLSPEYAPFYTADVQNIYQNCFNPASSLTCTGNRYCCDNVPSVTACSFPLPLRPLPLTP